MSRDLSEFGTLLRRLREAAGLTQDDLAERAGLTAQGVSALERGHRRRPYQHTVQALADALGLSASAREDLLASSRPRATPDTVQPARPGLALPIAPTRLIGREEVSAAVQQVLVARETQFVTLTGPGGVGKTRLALEIARGLESGFSQGVAFVPLAALVEPGLVIETIARTLGLLEVPGDSLVEQLSDYLRERRLLVVLDNCEHLLDAASDLAAMLSMCPGVSVLATSRAPFRIRGERVYPLAPLAVPVVEHATSLHVVVEAPAAQLFVERARDLVGYECTDVDAPAIAGICQRLDGLPLGLELAAPWLRLLSTRALLSRLDEVLPSVAVVARDLPERHRTLTATLDWSHDLLLPSEQALFRRVSVFVGGCTIDAVEAVCADAGMHSVSAPPWEQLAALVDKSLLSNEVQDGVEPRLRMLETIRSYARERLKSSGEDVELERRHAEYYLKLAETAEPNLHGPQQATWRDRLGLVKELLPGFWDFRLSGRLA